MVRKLLLLLRTLRHLKLQQIIYQVYFRLRPTRTLSHYEKEQIPFTPLIFLIRPASREFCRGNNNFIFLNKVQQFGNEINWNFQGYGKLWNYNLQYFNYLGQDNISNIVKENWLTDIGNCLNDGRLVLEPYPVCLRVMNTIRFLSFNRINNIMIIENVFAQLKYLNEHLEYHILGNHLLENAFALFMGGHAYQKVGWQKKGKKILYHELREQILDDGGHFELSPMYHQIILFRVLELTDWYSKVNDPDIEFLDFVKNKGRQMLSWLQIITFKNGDIPHLNDSAIDIAFTSGELFQFAGLLNLTPIESLTLGKSGYRKYELDDYECVVDVAELGPSYQPGHSHADALSFILYKNKKPFIVEVGTSTYQPGQRRDYERSTSAHNTILVHSKNQSEVWGSFRVGSRASVKIIHESETQLEARHDGYYQSFKVCHTRKFNFSVNTIEVLDYTGHTSSKLILHFHPDYEVLLGDDNVLSINEIAFVKFENADKVSLKEYEFARGFNQYIKALKVEVDFKNQINTTIVFL